MKKFSMILVALIFVIGCGTPTKKSYNEGINIIPTPLNISEVSGDPFVINAQTSAFVEGETAQTIAQFFFTKIRQSTGYDIAIGSDPTAPWHLSIDETLPVKAEGYQLEVQSDRVSITGKDAAGLFYGMQTLLQLLPAEIESTTAVRGVAWEIPAVKINDEPRFEYRGTLLDPSRHFVTTEFIKKQLDVLALFKINRFHWHLTDDQGWRMEIKKYPKLTEIGATRVEGEGTTHTGFYTQEEIKEVVEYAAERYITVIPELEIPGHELAAIAAYPELSCQGEPITPRIIWGVEDIVMCPGKELMFEFLEDVIDEMVALFPSEYYHIGGDECPKMSWKNCPRCQQRIREERLDKDPKHTPEECLQSYVIQRVEKMLAARGKRIIGWDEILEGGLAPTAAVMSWRGEEGGIDASMQNHEVIMTPSNAGMYINFYQGDSKIEPVTIGGSSSLQAVYGYNPVPDTLVKMGKERFVKGVQCNLWAEYLYSPEVREYHLFPQILALSETAWSSMENKNFDDFCRRLNNACVRMDCHQINYRIPRPQQPHGSCNFVAFVDSAVLEFYTTRPMKMVYSFDNQPINEKSAEYTQPIVVKRSCTLNIASVLPSGKLSPVRNIVVEQQTYAPATELTSPQPGLNMQVTYGMYLNSSALEESAHDWEVSTIDELTKIRSVEPSWESMRGVKHYAAVAEGYVEVPEDGVYYFSSNNNEVWLDGKLLIDNNNEVKRFSRHDRSVALAKGFHPMKVQFLGHIIGGWPSIWDDGNVWIRREGEEHFRKIDGEMLWRE